MTASSVPDLDAASLIQKISEGEVARDFVLLIARGFLPIPQDELASVLLYLIRSPDAEIAELSLSALRDLPPRIILGVARDPNADATLLATLTESSTDPAIIEAILRNRATPDEQIEALARRVSATLLDVIVINQERILRRPSILDALLSNPALTLDVRRRAMELREEFFDKAQRQVRPVETFEDDLTPEQQAELDALVAEAAKYENDPPSPVPPDFIEEADRDSAWRRILVMGVADKVRVAFRGGLTERSILIRDRNKLVCSAVVRSPRVTENEIEAYAGMRNVDDEVLRLIGTSRHWVAKYPVVWALVRNPKTPIGIVLPLINRLTLKDLKNLGSDKGVSETVRSSARRLYLVRRQK